MKLKKQFKQILCGLAVFIIFCNIIGASSDSFPKELKINVSKNDIYQVEYVGFDISSRKMSIKGRDEIAYCLEIDKNYPGDQVFKLNRSADEKISSIIAAGYPNRSAKDLNVSNDDEAYFATQVAIWSYIEGYNLNKLKGNKKVINAIKNIYNYGLNNTYTSNSEYKVYTPSNKSIQEAVVIFDKKNISEEPIVPETKPENPSIPEEPSIPEKPIVPDVPNVPETPTVPETPVVPETPTTPEIKPEIPNTPPSISDDVDGGENKVESAEPIYPPQEG